MQTAAAQTDPAPDLAPDPAAERAARQAAMLQGLAEIGMRMARCLDRQAEATAEAAEAAPLHPGAAESAGRLAEAFGTVSRAVRLSLTLEEKFATGSLERKRRMAEEDHARAAERRMLARERRSLVGLSLVGVIDASDGPEGERLFDAAETWLEEADEALLAEHTVGEVLKRVCRDLRLPLDPILCSQQDASGEHAVEIALAAHRDAAGPPGQRRGGPTLGQLMTRLGVRSANTS